MARKPYVNTAPDMRKTQMNEALVRALDPLLARIVLKKIANIRSTALEQQTTAFICAASLEIHQEDNTRTHIDRH